jgi:ketosteroid isomerase-like protein
MEPALSRIRDAVQIRRIVENWAEAIREKDSKLLISDLAPDVLVYRTPWKGAPSNG